MTLDKLPGIRGDLASTDDGWEAGILRRRNPVDVNSSKHRRPKLSSREKAND